MTDKEQIIVDDCKVEECVNFRDEVSIDSTVLKNACSIGLWQRHYKNLEESCKMSCKCDENPNCYFKQLARKTQECEELEEQDYKNLKIIHSDFNQIKSLRAENDSYRKALEEIEEIVNKKTETSICSECAYNHIPECKDNCMQDVLENILSIINKAKGDGNE